MKKYILTFESLTGSLTLGYNTFGFLVLVQNETSMTDEAIAWVFQNIPVEEKLLVQFSTRCKATVETVPTDLTFGAFWEAYGKKINRIRCETIYKKLSEHDRLKCMKNIKHYERYLERSGFRAKADPENYLKRGYYDTDWRRER